MENRPTQYPEIDQQQLQIADSGSDVNQPVGDEMGQMQQPTDFGYEAEADYMAGPSEPPMPQNSSSLSAEAMKMMHLFDLSQDLYEYGKILGDNLTEIDESLLEIDDVALIRQLEERLKEFKKKTRDFIVEVFYKETYEKNLYIYMTLRHELVTMVKFLRTLLSLNTLVIETKDEKNKKGNK